MRADLYEPGPVQHDDQIGHADCGETVGDQDCDAAIAAAGGTARWAGAGKPGSGESDCVPGIGPGIVHHGRGVAGRWRSDGE